MDGWRMGIAGVDGEGVCDDGRRRDAFLSKSKARKTPALRRLNVLLLLLSGTSGSHRSSSLSLAEVVGNGICSGSKGSVSVQTASTCV